MRIAKLLRNLLYKVAPENRLLLENSFFLLVLQGVNYVLPLVTLPYLARVLEPAKFGVVAFVQAFMQYFILSTDYGFNFSATREISIYRDDTEKVSQIVSTVSFIKLFFLIVSFLVLLLLTNFFERFRSDALLYHLAFGIVIGNFMFPTWFFQGIERMKYVTILNALAKFIFTILIFVFVKEKADYLYVPLMNSLGYLVSGAIGLWIMLRNFTVRLQIPDKALILNDLKDSFQFFLSRISVSLYTSSNVFFLGLLGDDAVTGYYAAAEKLYTALKRLYEPVVNALYPFMAKNKNVRLFKKIFFLLVGGNLLICILLLIFNQSLMRLVYGDGFGPSVGIFNALVVALILVVPSMLLGYPFLAALQHEKYANSSVVISSIFHVMALGIVLFVLRKPYWIAVLLIITESIALAIRLFGIRREGLWKVSELNVAGALSQTS